jgi:hypothetical protein
VADIAFCLIVDEGLELLILAFFDVFLFEDIIERFDGKSLLRSQRGTDGQ